MHTQGDLAMSSAIVQEKSRTIATRTFNRLLALDKPDLYLSPSVEAGLAACLEAFIYAQDLGHPIWDFAVELSTMRRLKLSRSDLRWLVGKGLLECAIDTTKR